MWQYEKFIDMLWDLSFQLIFKKLPLLSTEEEYPELSEREYLKLHI